MPLKSMTVEGLRGYATPQRLELAIPDGNSSGSGLTIIVGANGSGKTTLVEALQFLQRADAVPPIPEGRRNALISARVRVVYEDQAGIATILATQKSGGGDPAWQHGRAFQLGPVWVVPPRRAIPDGDISKTAPDRLDYLKQLPPGGLRSQYFGNFGNRLSAASKNRESFNEVFSRVIDPPPDWYAVDSGQGAQNYALRFRGATGSHDRDGVSEGYASLFWVIDGLYASQEGDLIVIDEPELSLHPTLQRRLAQLLADYSSSRQIVVATHSPYFADWLYIFGGAHLARVSVGDKGGRVHNLSRAAVKRLASQADDRHNPHVLGLDAREVFFLNDGVILTEGADDVIGYEAIADQLNMRWGGNFYGWGVGGAEKMHSIAHVLSDLGFEKVFGILDADQASTLEHLRKEYPSYRFCTIPAKDVRTKAPRRQSPGCEGLLDASGRLRSEYVESLKATIGAAREYMQTR